MSVKERCTLPSKPLVFTTLHPSEWYMEDTYISVIELQRDVKLLFMINAIHRLRILSALNTFIEDNNLNLAKQNSTKIQKWLPRFQEAGLDGWFTSIENKSTIEFAIRTDPSVLKILECHPIRLNWKNSWYTQDMNIIPKNWGTAYPLSSLEKPVKFILNSRFKPMIEAYQKQIAEEDPRGTAFSVLLENAEISYFDAPVEKVKW